jgi:hypothetical protein
MFEDGPQIFQNLGTTSKLWAKKGDMQLVPYSGPTDRRYRTRFVHPVCVCVCVCVIFPEVKVFESLCYTEIRCKLRISSLRSFPYSFSSYDVFSLRLVISMQERSSMASAPRDSHLLGAVGASETNLRVSVTMRPCCELFLGAFAKLRKATVASSCLSLRMEQLSFC